MRLEVSTRNNLLCFCVWRFAVETRRCPVIERGFAVTTDHSFYEHSRSFPKSSTVYILRLRLFLSTNTKNHSLAQVVFRSFVIRLEGVA